MRVGYLVTDGKLLAHFIGKSGQWHFQAIWVGFTSRKWSAGVLAAEPAAFRPQRVC